MSCYTEHRLYVHISEPIRFLGLTTGELILGLGGLLGVIFNSDCLWSGTFYLVGGWGSIGAMRQFKKHKVGGNLQSLLLWYGLRPAPSYWPAFDCRRWVG